MPIRLPMRSKSIAQSLIPLTSRSLEWQRTDVILSATAAYIEGVRGLGWSPSVEQEAISAARWMKYDEGFVVIDAGANVGNWITTFCRTIKSKGHIYAFEPQPGAAAVIRDRHIDGCEVSEVALGSKAGKMTFYTEHQTDTRGSLYERHDSFVVGKQYKRTEVEVMLLDDFVQTHAIRKIDFMKMDLEGAELEALKGASACMREGILRAFSFEFGVSNVNARVFFLDIFNLLGSNHYEIFRLTPGGRLIHVNHYSEDLEIFARTTTYFARYAGLQS
jgi:FkbM family methyltransferase